jgi:hypothetical protein
MLNKQWPRASCPHTRQRMLLGEILRARLDRECHHRKMDIRAQRRSNAMIRAYESAKGSHAWPDQSYATSNSTELMVVLSLIETPLVDYFSFSFLVCMILTGVGSRLQTWGGLAAQWSDSTLRTASCSWSVAGFRVLVGGRSPVSSTLAY